MDLTELEYTDFVLNSLVKDRPVVNIIFYNALNGISNFLKSDMNGHEKKVVSENINILRGVKNIIEIYYNGGSCIREIIEVNYLDFRKLIDQLK
jgi:hypothetical protein